MTRIRLTAALAVLVLIAAPAHGAPAKKARLEFRASLDKPAYGPNDPVMLSFTLKNTGKAAVWVNTRFYTGSKDAAPDDREVALTLTSPSGREIECIYNFPTGLPKTDFFKLVAPGEAVSSEQPRDLRNFFKLTDPGTYTLAVAYHNMFGAELGLDAATGPFASPPVTFTIAP